MKRSNFSRLYFLSDDELLKILSNTKDPKNINLQLRKIFECMELLIFDEEGMITHMCSKEGEQIPLLRPIKTADDPVEIWCKIVENEMIDAVRDAMMRAVKNYAEIPRKEWVKKWQGQCVLNGSQVYWTKETEEAITQNTLHSQVEKANQQIVDLVQLVRTKLKPLEKKNICPLIVQGVHERNILENLDACKISNVFEFEWISQLRFYIEKNDLWARCMQTTFP